MIKRILILSLIGIQPALAVKTQFFTQSTRADFESGTLESLVATNFGELKLARATETVLEDQGRYASIDAVAEGLDGTIYLGTNASGLLLALKDGKTTTLADYGESASVSALAVAASGTLLAGVSGESAKLFAMKAGTSEPELVVELPDEQYIWSIALAADGKVYLATGPNGVLYEVDVAEKTSRVLFESEENNLRSVVAINDLLFVGTDPNGLILKVDRKSGKASVVFDAPESEVSALLLDPRNGQIYAGTSQLVEGAEDSAATEPQGHPTDHIAGEPLFVEPSDTPQPKPSEGEDTGQLEAPHDAPAAGEEAEHGAETQPAPQGPSPAGPITRTGGDEPAADGNAVYRIDSQGFVSEVFREQAMIFAMARLDNQLLIATGPNGTLYQLDLTTEEHSAVAKLRAQVLTSSYIAGDQSIYIGTGLAATLSKLSPGLATTGTFISSVLDAQQVSAFGKVQVRGALPGDTSMMISTRSGNVSDETSPLWSEWTEAVAAARFTTVATPPGRYLQYRVTLKGSGTATPTLEDISIAYQQPNVAPRIESVTVSAEPTEDGSPQPLRTINWMASEPNGDDLQFSIYIRSGAGSPWVQVAKELTDVTWQWDTRKVSDGRYQVQVEASDALANAQGMGKTASRIAEVVQIDNTPPAIGDIKLTREDGKTTIAVRVADRGGVVSGLEFAVDGTDHWQSVPPSDMLNDSPDEQYAIVLADAGDAARVVSIRSRDESGNMAYESVTIRPQGK